MNTIGAISSPALVTREQPMLAPGAAKTLAA
jgi:hypothetical protein